jgi:transposase-like protein/DNA-binding CsgD family transcriptional regulator
VANKKTPEAIKELIIQDYLVGDLIENIATRYGCTKSHVNRLCRSAGIENRKANIVNKKSGHKRLKITNQMLSQAIDMYNQGISTEKISVMFNVSASTIADHLKKNGVILNSQNTKMKKIDDIEKICSLYISGKSLMEISKINRISPTTLANRLQKNGVKIRDRNSKIVLSDDIVNRIVKSFLEDDVAVNALVKQYDITEWVIYRILKERKIETKSPSHPKRVEKARQLMIERLKNNGCIKVGNGEKQFVKMLCDIYGAATPQFQIDSRGHHYDVLAGGILWEYDEKRHNWKRQKELDKKYDENAKEKGYEVRRIRESDFFIHGLEKWHNYQ